MKSTKYNSYRRSKYKFPTKHIRGSGKTKGAVIPGSKSALADIESQLGRKVEVHHTRHRIGEWVFVELKGEASKS